MAPERVAIFPPAAPALEWTTGLASPWRLTGAENFLMTVVSSIDTTLLFQGRILRPNNTTENFNYNLPVVGNRVQAVFFRPAEAGQLLHIRIASTANAKVGQTFIRLILTTSLAIGSFTALGVILQGYVATGNDLAWPGSPIFQSTDGPGLLRLVTGSSSTGPNAALITVPAAARWHVLSASCTLTCSGVAGNRVNTLSFLTDGAVQVFFVRSSLTQIAFQANQHQYAPIYNFVPYANINYGTGPLLPHRALPALWSISFVTEGADVGDATTNVQALVEEWIEP